MHNEVIDLVQLAMAIALTVVWTAGGMWLSHNWKYWRMFVPAAMWLLDASIYTALTILVDAEAVQFGMAVWAAVVIIHAALTFLIYFRIMGGHHG